MPELAKLNIGLKNLSICPVLFLIHHIIKQPWVRKGREGHGMAWHQNAIHTQATRKQASAVRSIRPFHPTTGKDDFHLRIYLLPPKKKKTGGGAEWGVFYPPKAPPPHPARKVHSIQFPKVFQHCHHRSPPH